MEAKAEGQDGHPRIKAVRVNLRQKSVPLMAPQSSLAKRRHHATWGRKARRECACACVQLCMHVYVCAHVHRGGEQAGDGGVQGNRRLKAKSGKEKKKGLFQVYFKCLMPSSLASL